MRNAANETVNAVGNFLAVESGLILAFTKLETDQRPGFRHFDEANRLGARFLRLPGE